MKAVYLEAGRISVRETEQPPRKPGYALLRTLLAGICNTDLELQRGYYNFSGVPGHEFVAEVIEASRPGLIGKRVVGEINIDCAECALCSSNLGRHCLSRKVLGIIDYPGAFAEYISLPERNLHVVPDEIPTQFAVFTEPLAAACEILDQVTFTNGELIAVLGDGKLGLLIAQVLQLSGAQVVLFGHHQNKLDLVKRLGVQTDSSLDRPNAAFGLVVEATGSAGGLREAISMTRARGTVVMKSTVHESVSLDTAPVIVNELSLIGSRCGRFEPAIELLRKGKLRVAEMLAAEYLLEDAANAFERAAQPGTLKVLLRNVAPAK